MSITRLNKERYAVHGGWRCAVERVYRNRDWPDQDLAPQTITIDIADLLEKRSGFVWSNGAYRVTLKNVPDMRSKTFYGETAWSNAARYAADAATKCGDWRWWPDL